MTTGWNFSPEATILTDCIRVYVSINIRWLCRNFYSKLTDTQRVNWELPVLVLKIGSVRHVHEYHAFGGLCMIERMCIESTNRIKLNVTLVESSVLVLLFWNDYRTSIYTFFFITNYVIYRYLCHLHCGYVCINCMQSYPPLWEQILLIAGEVASAVILSYTVVLLVFSYSCSSNCFTTNTCKN